MKPAHNKPRWLVGSLLALFTAVSLCCADSGRLEGNRRFALQPQPAKLPVILLTGFEPFGSDRSPNPSWESIKTLDGREWKGYKLVCKQMAVVWASPRKQLEGWIAEHKPVAIFSFGQGGKGSFCLESKASNTRTGLHRQQGPKAGHAEDRRGRPR